MASSLPPQEDLQSSPDSGILALRIPVVEVWVGLWRGVYFLLTLFCIESVRCPTKSRGTYRSCPCISCLDMCMTSPIIDITEWHYFFFNQKWCIFKKSKITHNHSLNHHNHSKSIVYRGVHSWSCPFSGLGYMDNMHHCNIMQSIFTALKIHHTLPSHLFPA